MNITNTDECIEEWERDLAVTSEDPSIPQDDRDRVLEEKNRLYNELYDLLITLGYTPQFIQSKLDENPK